MALVRGVMSGARVAGVEVGITGPAVGKHDPGPAQHEGIGRGHERVRRQDHLVARADAVSRAAISRASVQEVVSSTLPEAVLPLEETVAAPGKLPVPRKLPQVHRLLHVQRLVAGQVGFIEADHLVVRYWLFVIG
jgi:hypothetical protein